MSNFARSFMNKHGWVEGKGLGVNEDGISEPIKVKIKNDLTGVGYDNAQQFTNFWWEDAFNKASANISVKNSSNTVDIISAKNEENEKLSVPLHLPYKDFIRTKLMVNGVVENLAEQSSSDDDDEKYSKSIDDHDQLLKVCEGRTAHKGARHGITQAGKLARLAQCEQSFLIKNQSEKSDESCCPSKRNDGISASSLKKRKYKNNKINTKRSKLNPDVIYNKDCL